MIFISLYQVACFAVEVNKFAEYPSSTGILVGSGRASGVDLPIISIDEFRRRGSVFRRSAGLSLGPATGIDRPCIRNVITYDKSEPVGQVNHGTDMGRNPPDFLSDPQLVDVWSFDEAVLLVGLVDGKSSTDLCILICGRRWVPDLTHCQPSVHYKNLTRDI